MLFDEYCNAGCHYAEYHYAELYYAEYHYAELYYAEYHFCGILISVVMYRVDMLSFMVQC
jgi:hypothetical protein